MDKICIILCDGMADRPIDSFGGRTPLESSDNPNMKKLAELGTVGRMRTLYDGLPTGSDVANLSVLGFDPHTCYTGRSPIEALGLGIKLDDDDVVFRMNLIHISGSDNPLDCKIIDHSSDKITTEEATELVNALKLHFENYRFKFHPGVSYRHCLVLKGMPQWSGELIPPHDVLGSNVVDMLPQGDLAAEFKDLMVRSYDVLMNHPVNKKRMERGLKPANCPWFWGAGKKPVYTPFKEKFNIDKGMLITAVPLIMGLGVGLGLDYTTVPGATGDYYTNYQGKAEAAIKSFEDGYEFVFIHIEAPDECGHDGDADLKKASIEQIDKQIVGPVYEYLNASRKPFKIVITPDHATPCAVRTHTTEEIPFIYYSSHSQGTEPHVFSEKSCRNASLYFEDGYKLMSALID